MRLLLLSCGLLLSSFLSAESLHFDFTQKNDSQWIGPGWWVNRPMDWQVIDSQLHCVNASKWSNIQFVDQFLDASKSSTHMSFSFSYKGPDSFDAEQDAIAFSINSRHPDRYRSSAIYPIMGKKHIVFGYALDGSLFIDDASDPQGKLRVEAPPLVVGQVYKIDLKIDPVKGKNVSTVTFNLLQGDKVLSSCQTERETKELSGIIGLHTNAYKKRTGGTTTDTPTYKRHYIIDDLRIDGTFTPNTKKLGPIVFPMYTLSKGELNAVAQLMPLSEKQNYTVELERKVGKTWKPIAKQSVDNKRWHADFSVPQWDDTRDADCRFSLQYEGKTYHMPFTVLHDPKEAKEIRVAGFTCNAYPDDERLSNRSDIIESVNKNTPHILIFTGDQFYQHQPTPAIYSFKKATPDEMFLDYLYKWLSFGWTYQELLQSYPSVMIVDDHDIYHGNLWGAAEGEKRRPLGRGKGRRQDSGGYINDYGFVRRAEDTQYAHLPRSGYPNTAKDGIGSYFTSLLLGRLSIAVIEDRKFKESPTRAHPDLMVTNGIFQGGSIEPDLKTEGIPLLGDQQMRFLKDWASDWKGCDMKLATSATLLASLQTRREDDTKTLADGDTNGWPMAGRNHVLKTLRTGYAVMLTGDQHLGSVVHHGVDSHGDSGISFCVPATTNTIFKRRWMPSKKSTGYLYDYQKTHPYAGNYLDGFHNKVSIMAVGNAGGANKQADGYGMLLFNTQTREIVLESHSRSEGFKKQYSGWPVTVQQLDNFAYKSAYQLPKITVTGIQHAVVKVINQKNDEIVCSYRMADSSCQLSVAEAGVYRIEVGDYNASWKTYSDIEAKEQSDAAIKCDFK